MKMKVLGVQPVNYDSKKTGEHVSGSSLHVVYNDAQVQGQAVDKVFISSRLNLPAMALISVGSDINIEYNGRGYVQDIALLPPAPAPAPEKAQSPAPARA